MATIETILLCFSGLLLVAAMVCGGVWHRAEKWTWVDPLYYSLGILGVLLFFVSNERSRTLAELYVEQLIARQTLGEHEAQGPDPIALALQHESIKSDYDFLILRVKLGDICKLAHSTDVNCLSAEAHSRAITSIFEGFEPLLDESDAERHTLAAIDFCQRGWALIKTLKGEGLVSQKVFAALEASLRQLKAKQSSPLEWYGLSTQSRQKLTEKLASQRNTFTKMIPESKRVLLAELWDTESKFAQYLFFPLSTCTKVPDSVEERAQLLQEWKGKRTQLVANRRKIDERIRSLEGADPSPSPPRRAISFLLNSLWPFVLVAAFALKLTKAFAAVRHSRLRRTNPNAN